MASESKKRKAKNSYMHNGGEKCDKKMKRIMYFTKRKRKRQCQKWRYSMGIVCDVTRCVNNNERGFCELEDIYISDAEIVEPMCQDMNIEEEESNG